MARSSSDILLHLQTSDKSRAMLAGRHTVKSGCKSTDKPKEEARFARQEELDEESNATRFSSFLIGLKACALKKDLHQVTSIHTELRQSGLLQKDQYLGNTLVSVYAKCGALTKAREVLDGLPVRDAITWNALIAGYAQHGCGKEALGCFHRMRREGLSPNAVTYACTLKACGLTKDLHMGERIHDEIASQGLLEKAVVLRGALVDMYAKCAVLAKAQKVLDGLPVRNVITWNALIAGYAQNDYGKEALCCFHRMRREGLSPDAITYACTLKACGLLQDLHMGERIHDEIASQGLLERAVVLPGALVDMYAKCGALAKAQKVLDALSLRDVVSWNALIAGYAQHGCGKEALGCFHEMRREGLSPDAITYACTLKACGLMQDVDMGERIHYEIASQGLLEKAIVLGGALVDMYAKCGALSKAQKVIDGLSTRNVISWSALIAGYAQHGFGKEALGCFHQMRRDGLSPDAITYACTLKACGLTQDVDMGERIHEEIASQGLLEKAVVLGGSLIDMYAKCGALLKAQKVLDGLSSRNVVSWSALIAGYAQHGCGKEALGCFNQMRSEGFSPNEVSWSALIGGYAQQGLAEEALNCFRWMQQEGTSPNAITFASVLNACSHSGLLDEGQMLFDSMREKYGIIPDKEHYTCMVDLFGRARHFDKAMRVIEMMPSSDYPPIWSALLGACRKWENVELGRLAFERAIELDECNAAAYVLMSNIYAGAGMQEAAENIECMRIRNGARKQPGRSCWTDASGKVHRFVVGNSDHPQSRQIYLKLQELELKLSLQGYSPSLHWVSRNIPLDSKKALLCQHSEKLAIACAIINTPQRMEIRITKNMRVCGDCHVATSLISKIEKRKIVVKDANRLHVFEGGKCSCGDYQ
ncbi:hypothetical protein GOP47_0005610 [Adiantum capillus-veneris]|uniref:DYW domain-containing protein n=1 Tax=Adiantum capillus-veneris TaxID=13818 RepID=A0A9D4V5E3_ADICA|nr:hypothetical protein GOP47_0005610 [Adiantum capillus-veneris]